MERVQYHKYNNSLSSKNKEAFFYYPSRDSRQCRLRGNISYSTRAYHSSAQKSANSRFLEEMNRVCVFDVHVIVLFLVFIALVAVTQDQTIHVGEGLKKIGCALVEW